MGFEWAEQGSFSFLRSQEWSARGIVHGFIGSADDFSAARLAERAQKLAQTLGVKRFFAPRQVHGDVVLDLSSNEPAPGAEADGILFDTKAAPEKEGILLAVRSADCVPIFIEAEGVFVLIHAGWRGLANGIIEKALKILKSRGKNKIEALIGPCAGLRRYEVGFEVIEQIGESGVSIREGAKWHLDLALSAKNQIERSAQANVQISNYCTIEDRRFHSFRRDGEAAGRNLAFILMPDKR